MTGSGAIETVGDEAVRRETRVSEHSEDIDREDATGGLGTTETITDVNPIVIGGNKMNKTETGEKTGENSGISSEMTSEGGGGNGEGVVKGDSETEGAVVKDRGQEGSNEMKVRLVFGRRRRDVRGRLGGT